MYTVTQPFIFHFHFHLHSPYYYSGSLNQWPLLFGALSKGETFCVRSHTVKSIWKCRPPGGRHFDVGFINQALLAKVSPLDKVSFCGGKKRPLLVGLPTNQIGTWFKLPECVRWSPNGTMEQPLGVLVAGHSAPKKFQLFLLLLGTLFAPRSHFFQTERRR